jgi:enoyl-CoA hydratase/carnithine racemase
MKDDLDELVLAEKISLKMSDQYLGLVTFNRPKEMNPLNWAMVKKLKAVIEGFSSSKGIRVIAFTGAGKAFSAGGDLKAYQKLYRDEEAFRGFLGDFRALNDTIASAKQPVIALVNGHCVAGGLELMLACDFAYAGRSAKIGDGHSNFGQVGGAGSNVRLPRSILPPKARELLFTGKLLSADEACEWGLVNKVVPDDQLMDAGLEFANMVASKSPLGIGIIKEVCNSGLEMRLEDALHLEIEKVVHYCTHNRDSHEGLVAFSEKRQPKFEGR